MNDSREDTESRLEREQMGRLRAQSDPPDVREAQVWKGAVVDVAGVAGLVTLLVSRAVPPGYELHAFGGIFFIVGGAQLLRAIGKNPGLLMLGYGGGKALGAFLVAHAARTSFAVLLALTLGGCDFLRDAGHTIADASKVLCLVFGEEQGEKALGMTPQEFCDIAENVAPFLSAAQMAQAAATGEAKAGLHARQ